MAYLPMTDATNIGWTTFLRHYAGHTQRLREREGGRGEVASLRGQNPQLTFSAEAISTGLTKPSWQRASTNILTAASVGAASDKEPCKICRYSVPLSPLRAVICILTKRVVMRRNNEFQVEWKIESCTRC